MLAPPSLHLAPPTAATAAAAGACHINDPAGAMQLPASCMLRMAVHAVAMRRFRCGHIPITTE